MRKLAHDGVASKRSSIRAILDLFQEAYKPDFRIYRAILESFCYAYSAIVDSFVIVSFFLERLYSILRSIIVTNMLHLCQIMPMFWPRWLLFSV